MLTPPDTIQSEPWMLDPHMTYLNHGSFGARTSHVYESQQKFKKQFEHSPIQFLDRTRNTLINEARAVVSQFLHCHPDGFGFVDNATTGVGCVAHAITFEPTDEILTTNHVYNGVRQLLSHRAACVGCTYRELSIPLPVQHDDELLQAITNSFTSATKLFVVDHVASASSIIFPVAKIAQECRKRGILLLIDGAHAPGMLQLHIDSLNADWYVGNLHKWVCAPVGAGFIWTNEKHRDCTHPLTVSHFLNTTYTSEFDWQGTKDISPWLSAATAIQVGDEIGWSRIRMHNHTMAVWMHQQLIHGLHLEPITPMDGSMIGSMATVKLPDDFPQTFEECEQLISQLYSSNRIEVPIFLFEDHCFLRVSAQLYTKKADIGQLIDVLKKVRMAFK